MPEVLDPQVAGPPVSPLLPGVIEVDERAARRSLLEQIARLEAELSALFCTTFPRHGFDWGVSSRGGPRVLTLSELERVRDALVERLQINRAELGQRTHVEEQYRRLIEEMMLSPEEHQWERVSAADIGERGCKHWHVRPKWGVLGVIMSWWRVVISSGCPLARGRGLRP
jgi:hypothetical protein